MDALRSKEGGQGWGQVSHRIFMIVMVEKIDRKKALLRQRAQSISEVPNSIQGTLYYVVPMHPLMNGMYLNAESVRTRIH